MGKEKRSQVSACVTPDAERRGVKKPNLMETPVVTVSMDTDAIPSAVDTVDRELLRNSLRDETVDPNAEEVPASGLLDFDAVGDEWEGDWDEGEDWWTAVEERIDQIERRVESRLHAKLGEYEDEMICWRVQMEKELLAVREDQTYFARVMNELKVQEAERARSAGLRPRGMAAPDREAEPSTPARSSSPTLFITDGVRVERTPDPKQITSGYFGIGGVETMPVVNVQHTAVAAAAGQVGHPQRQAMPPMLGTSPALLALQASVRVPHFDGDDSKWVDFEEDWDRYAPYALLGSPEGPVGAIWKRDLLINCLHGVLRNKYKSMITRMPSLKFEDIWEELVKLFRIDNPYHWRKKWGNIQLVRNGEEIRLQDWIFFESLFEVAKSRVQDWTEQEEVDMLLKQMPPVGER